MIKIESTTETIESKGGLILAGKIAKKAGLARIKSALANNAGAVIVSLFGRFGFLEGNSGAFFVREPFDFYVTAALFRVLIVAFIGLHTV